MRCLSTRHEWLDPASAARCCSPFWKRATYRPENIPAKAAPDGRVHVGNQEVGYMVNVWIPIAIPRADQA